MKLHKFAVAAAVTLAASSLLAQNAPAVGSTPPVVVPGAAGATGAAVGAVITPVAGAAFVVTVAVIANKTTPGTTGTTR
ncbi:MAG: hypothetical protein NTU86_08880 [Burkholderiales bacterium]|nr:hypothetical protein [Burkholderiales bacterium]